MTVDARFTQNIRVLLIFDCNFLCGISRYLFYMLCSCFFIFDPKMNLQIWQMFLVNHLINNGNDLHSFICTKYVLWLLQLSENMCYHF